MLDTHCHLTFPGLHDRLDEVLEAARADGVDRMICVGVTPDDAETARGIAESRDGVHFSAGIHPHYADRAGEGDVGRLAGLAAGQRCAAFGEMGLDYHYDDPPRETQHRMFAGQLEAVRESGIDKPIIIHNRKATDDTLRLIGDSGIDPQRFVFHCFAERPEEARKVLDVGAMISFTGIVTYKNAPEVRESAKLVPIERMMVETDAPFLTPSPHRKIKPNEPRYVVATARYLAELFGRDPDEFAHQMDANAERFFALNGSSVTNE